jgi:hypothetical protein
MCAVVRARRQSLAFSTKVRIVAHGALVTVSRDVASAREVSAKWSITTDTEVNRLRSRGASKRFIDWSETVSRVDNLSTLDTGCAVIEVRACEALVSNTNNRLS